MFPSGYGDDRLCDLSGCIRRSENFVAFRGGSVLLVCDPCTRTLVPDPTPEPSGVNLIFTITVAVMSLFGFAVTALLFG